MPRCLLALGANLGNRQENLQEALREIAALPQTCLLARSTWHEIPAVGGPADQHDFLNGAVLVDTMLAADALADSLHAIECQHGRERKVRWAARTLDIDLLLYGNAIIQTPKLTVPHPRMTFRRFVLAPAAEIAGQMVVPQAEWTIAALLTHLRTAARYVAITSADPQAADWLASYLCKQLSTPRLEDFFAKTPATADQRRAEADSHRLSAVEWKKHGELRKRLPSQKSIETEKIAPVISSLGCLGGHSEGLVDFVQPALVIAVAPSPGVSFQKPLKTKPRVHAESVVHGPLVQITADTPEQVIAEALAAIGAAWPV